ncbi:DUF2235 domain-containing protein [Candidatus Albibeggiatoa sp. nov. NOAA]|uniref:T6SS phospholipase effector Tle1-like catalytic domain-containing protein n=1 Tax=Candidatus Albibeggiatoa sp. nov. NOAA TaxID=3162724 RepID=UPI0032F44668|nr:DUF2235 domain-containing protein [Thiotrichaceae bacterium]
MVKRTFYLLSTAIVTLVLSVVGLLLIFYLSIPKELPPKTYQTSGMISKILKENSIPLPPQSPYFVPVKNNALATEKECKDMHISGSKGSSDSDKTLIELKKLEDFNFLGENPELREDLIRDLNTCYADSTSRNLVVFIDGTGQDGKNNTPTTNIWKLYVEAVKKAQTQPTIPFYHEGIGTSWGNKIFGKVTGYGIDRHIKKAYQFLAENYKEGDRIFIFGFSRGAYTARALNGMIEFVGLLDGNSIDVDMDRVKEARIAKVTQELFKLYHRKNDGLPLFDERLHHFIRDKVTEKYDGILRFYISAKNQPIVDAIGVFDTVPALGIGRDDYPDDYRVDLYAAKGFHALSLDEQRYDFRLLRFANYQSDDRIKEVWFAGDHTDIGGGHSNECEKTKEKDKEECKDFTESKKAQNGLEKVSLQWMMKQFNSGGYNIFNLPSLEDSCGGENKNTEGCEHGELHDKFLQSKLLYHSAGLHWRKPQPQDTLHKSILCRLKAKEAKSSENIKKMEIYRPGNLYYCVDKRGYKVEEDKDYICSNDKDTALPESYIGQECKVPLNSCDREGCSVTSKIREEENN